MNQFWKNNIVPVICLIITIGGLLINIGINQNKANGIQEEVTELKTSGSPLSQRNATAIIVLQKDFSDFKADTKEKIRDVEKLNRESADKFTSKLDEMSRQITVVVTWIEEQKRHDTNARKNP